MDYRIAVVPGDGIGPDITEQALRVLHKVGDIYGHNFYTTEYFAGGIAIDRSGEALPQETLDGCKKSDALLLGAVGGPKWDTLPGDQRPEQALLGLRSGLGLFANLRPAILYPQLKEASFLRQDLLEGGLDIMVVRELTGGIYFGPRKTEGEGDSAVAYDTLVYSVPEVKRIAKVAFESAMKRGKKLCSVDKANILDASRLWRKTVEEVAKDYPEVELTHMYVDNAAMQLVRNPQQFDVIVTSNMFGDILSDEASMITGSIGMLASASVGNGSFGMYEPIHGSAPDIAGKDLANPIATVLSVAMMLRYSLNLEKEALAVEAAVSTVLDSNYRTGDIMSEGKEPIGTVGMGDMLCEAIQ